MASKEEKKARKELKAAQKQERQDIRSAAKQRQKEIRLTGKKWVKAQNQANKEPAKIAHKQTSKERNRRDAIKKFQKARNNFMGLPPALWPLMLVVGYLWARNTWDKESRERDIREARRFLREYRQRRIQGF